MRAPAIGSCVGGVSWAKALGLSAREIVTNDFQNTFMLSKPLFNHEKLERKGRVEEILPSLKRKDFLPWDESCLFWTAPAERSGDGALVSSPACGLRSERSGRFRYSLFGRRAYVSRASLRSLLWPSPASRRGRLGNRR